MTATTNERTYMYVVKFNNGAWKLFNTVTYTDVAIYRLHREAQEACDRANKKG